MAVWLRLSSNKSLLLRTEAPNPSKPVFQSRCHFGMYIFCTNLLFFILLFRWTCQYSADTDISQKPPEWDSSPHRCRLTHTGATESHSIYDRVSLSLFVCSHMTHLLYHRGLHVSNLCLKPWKEESTWWIPLTQVLIKLLYPSIVGRTILTSDSSGGLD